MVNRFMISAYCRVQQAIADMFSDERGDTNIISIVIVLVVVIGLAAIFRTKIVGFVNNMWSAISKDMGSLAKPV